jgi:hypothetical protein
LQLCTVEAAHEGQRCKPCTVEATIGVRDADYVLKRPPTGVRDAGSVL